MLAVSTRLGPYEIVAALGAGGMGEVYRARDTRLGRDVAVKVLPELLAHDPERRGRFEREARAVAALSHPNILSIHDYGTHDAITYVVTELLEGQTLRTRLGTGPLPWRDAIEIGAAIAEGLHAAHAKGIVHRDIKPENLFLTHDGRVKILDFGLAQVESTSNSIGETTPCPPVETSPGMVMGTVGYMSPEQVRGQSIDARSDLFSFGCVLYELVTGLCAFHGGSGAETMTAILHDEPPEFGESGPRVPPDLDHVIRRCLAKKTDDRFQSARDLAMALRTTATQPSLAGNPTSRKRPLRTTLILTVAVVTTAMGIGWFVANRKGNTAGPSRNQPALTSALAVLPFENIGADPKTEYLSDALADHIINSLLEVRRKDLRVRPFTSVARFKRQQQDVPTIARALNVQMVVTGKLHKQDEDLSISIILVDPREDSQLWGKRYQGKLAGILNLQDQIARDVAASLHLQLTGEEQQRLAKRYTEDPEAYLLYREALHHLSTFTEEGLNTAIVYCERALKKDPKNALAYTGLGRCYLLLGTLHQGPLKTHPEARRLFIKALEIDDRLPEAHYNLGGIYLFLDWDWPAAERAFRRALDIDPAFTQRQLYGFYMAAMGRLPDALAEIRLGQDLDPLAAGRRNELAMCHNWMRQFDDAIVEAERALELNPNFPLAYYELGIAYAGKGMNEEGIARLNKGSGAGRSHARSKGILGCLHAAAGNRDEARKILEEITRLSEGRFGFALPIARLHAALGERDQAFEWLRKACDERDSSVLWIKIDHTMDSLRSDPRFIQILKDIRLPS